MKNERFKLNKTSGFIACLLFFGALLPSCSSDDEQNSDGRKLRQLTINDVSMTRATLTDNTSTLGASWEQNDKATCLNLSQLISGVLSYSDLTASSSGESSSFTGSVTCSEGDNLALIYPVTTPVPVSGGGGNYYTINLSGQKGTLTDLAKRYHYVYGVGEVKSVTDNTATATISEMKSLLTVCKFTFEDDSNHPIPVKTLSIGYGTDNSIGYPQSATVTLPTVELTADYPSGLLTINLESEKTDGVYVALLPAEEIKSDFYFSVTTGSGDTYTGTASAKLKAGRYYPVTLHLTKTN